MTNNHKATKGRSMGVFGKIVLCIVGLCLVFMLVQSVLLKTLGMITDGVVYYARQQTSRDEDDRYDPTRFELSYRYTVDGRTYEGKSTMYFEYGYVTEMGADGKEIPKTAVVRYLPAVPGWSEIVSVPGGKSSSTFMSNPIVWIGFGLLALILVAVVIHTRRLSKKVEMEK